MIKRFVSLLMVALLLLACSDTPDTTPVQTPVAEVVASPTTLATPLPSKAGSGTVRGRLLTPDENGEPYNSGVLYLGGALFSDDPTMPPLVRLDEATDPKANFRDPMTGEFVFTDVAPGDYILLIWTPLTTAMARYPGTDEDYIKISVEADKTTDLGTIPIP